MATVHPLSEGNEIGMEVALEEVETAMLRSLAEQLIALVAPEDRPDVDPLVAIVGIDPEATAPSDPALRRLLPDAYRDDEAASAEFRRFTERDLRHAKGRNAEAVLQALQSNPSRIRIDAQAAPAWLGFLNDTRLILGARLEITDDGHDSRESGAEDDPRAALFQVYDWLTFLEDALVQSLLGPA